MTPSKPCDTYAACNHHHALTDRHVVVDFGDGEFVANEDAVPLLRELNALGLRTRTHHIDQQDKDAFVGILLDENTEVEVRTVNEIHASRDRYNGMKELLIRWRLP